MIGMIQQDGWSVLKSTIVNKSGHAQVVIFLCATHYHSQLSPSSVPTTMFHGFELLRLSVPKTRNVVDCDAYVLFEYRLQNLKLCKMTLRINGRTKAQPGGRRLASTTPPSFETSSPSSADLNGVRGIAIRPATTRQICMKLFIRRILPVRADSRRPKGFKRLRKASIFEVFPLISTMTLCSLTSTILAPNC